jgi:hypothetical protein
MARGYPPRIELNNDPLARWPELEEVLRVGVRLSGYLAVQRNLGSPGAHVSQRNTVIRTLNDVGLAAWFGGSLMGAVGLNGAAEQEGGNLRTARVASNGWARWTPVNAAAIGLHLVGAVGIGVVNRRRMVAQRGVGAASVAKTVVTAAALAATAYARVLGKKIELASSPNPGDAQRAEDVPVEVEQAQQQLSIVQWTIPVLTGILEVLNALHGEQQRPGQQVAGVLQRAVSLPAQLRAAA